MQREYYNKKQRVRTDKKMFTAKSFIWSMHLCGCESCDTSKIEYNWLKKKVIFDAESAE